MKLEIGKSGKFSNQITLMQCDQLSMNLHVDKTFDPNLSMNFDGKLLTQNRVEINCNMNLDNVIKHHAVQKFFI